eukprot:scaffold48733_cov31-Tisochrysis_lutea.AAC.2
MAYSTIHQLQLTSEPQRTTATALVASSRPIDKQRSCRFTCGRHSLPPAMLNQCFQRLSVCPTDCPEHGKLRSYGKHCHFDCHWREHAAHSTYFASAKLLNCKHNLWATAATTTRQRACNLSTRAYASNAPTLLPIAP